MEAPRTDRVRSHRQVDSGRHRRQERRVERQEGLTVTSPTTAVDVCGLTRIFSPRVRSGPAVTAVRDLSFSVPQGAITALIGPNGSGKTTVLDIIAMLLLPTDGDVRVCGTSVIGAPASLRQHVAYCPAGSASFWPRLTGRENLECFASLAGLAPRERPSRLATAAERVGLDPAVLSRETRTYSDGQMQRLNLARALMRDAVVWLLDEPTRSLDQAAQASTWQLIRDAARERGVSVLVATHDAAGAAAHADAMVSLS